MTNERGNCVNIFLDHNILPKAIIKQSVNSSVRLYKSSSFRVIITGVSQVYNRCLTGVSLVYAHVTPEFNSSAIRVLSRFLINCNRSLSSRWVYMSLTHTRQ